MRLSLAIIAHLITKSNHNALMPTLTTYVIRDVAIEIHTNFLILAIIDIDVVKVNT